MLNELHSLSVALVSANIEISDEAPEYGRLPNSVCYRVWLDGNGNVTGIERLDKRLSSCCRKYGNNQRTFPAFNIAPLYRISSDEDIDIFDKIASNRENVSSGTLEVFCKNNNWSSKLIKKVSGCLHKKIPGMQENSAISELMRITHNMDGITFRKSLETYLLKKLESKENTKEYLPLLVYQGNKKKDPEKDEGSLSIILDLHDWERYGYPIASEHTTRQINNWLLMEENRHLSKRTADRYDAFGDP